MNSPANVRPADWVPKYVYELLEKYELREWRFQWSRTKRILGQCDYKNKLILISEHYAAVANVESIFQTCRHEVAHALAGIGAGHGRVWKEKCLLVGARPERCNKESMPDMPCKYKGICPLCGHVYQAHRRLKNMSMRTCSMKRCRARLQRKYIQWEQNS